AQVELVPIGHPVYDFLKRADLYGWIEGYNSSSLPLSRKQVAEYIQSIQDLKNNGNLEMSYMDKKLINDYIVEFGYEVYRDLRNVDALFKGGKIFNNDKQKFLFYYVDSNATLFWDINGWLSQRNSDGDSIKVNAIGLGEIGMRFRGTLFNSVGYYIRFSNGQRLSGKNKDVDFAKVTNPKWNANHKMKDEDGNFDSYEGYLRYSTNSEWLALTIGKEQITAGFGYIDKLFLSNNSVPFSFIRLDLKYKKLQYFFSYGSLRGDSLGREIEAKGIVTHRLNLNLFDIWKIGFFESLITIDRPFNFTYLNPFSFIRSADYSAGDGQSTLNNAIIGFDTEVKPFKRVAFQGTMLIDDLDFKTLFDNTRNGKPVNSNRFAWQAGIIWTDGFWVPNLTLALEYTRLNPFIYTHRTNKSQYTHWTLPLGHNLQPNSDEIALKIDYDITNRLNFKIIYQKQRHGEGLVFSGDTLKINYGGTLNRGDMDISIDNKFLQGNRIDKDIITMSLVWQPIRQFFIEGNIVYRFFNLITDRKKLRDLYWWFTARIDY
ncbi:MAG: capsule assembly Wzi family protein, partial [Ignavibacteria bacterium]|nr:capsule assembly Wzi family protein [Ignavibacteria bacterium]